MKKMILVPLACLALSGSASGLATTGYKQDLTWSFLQDQKKGVVFLSSCGLISGQKVVAIIPTTGADGWYAIIQDGAMSTSYGAIQIKDGSWKGYGFSGGIPVQEANARLADYLMNLPFKALAAKDFHEVFDGTPTAACPRI
jgi:hypothetical protein